MSDFAPEAVAPGTTACSLSEEPIFAWFDVRGDAQDDRLLRYVRQAAGCVLPRQPNRYTREAGYAFWLGPDQWLLALPRATSVAVETRLLAGGDQLLAANDVTSAYCLFTVAGGLAERVLRSGTSYDLARLGAMCCAQTQLGKTQVLIWQPQAETYHLLVRRSFASYLWRWLDDAISVWEGV
ncbi:MAG: sarcosine oxidase subunit gamma [Pseudomonadales bacterium]|nr:sarcosine oxidase subunit gamma [Pseudomonadales bacterium]MCP5183912.1 sarcosine oxidase subunit gamma [Pseudomonadales bacterium]